MATSYLGLEFNFTLLSLCLWSGIVWACARAGLIIGSCRRKCSKVLKSAKWHDVNLAASYCELCWRGSLRARVNLKLALEQCCSGLGNNLRGGRHER